MGLIVYIICTLAYNIISNEYFFQFELKWWFQVHDPQKMHLQVAFQSLNVHFDEIRSNLHSFDKAHQIYANLTA